MLSISFEVDIPTEKVGGRQLFERQERKLPRWVWGQAPPRKFWNIDAWKWYFQRFPDSIWALRTIKIKTILTIFYVYYNPSFPQNLNHWLLEKSEMINLQMHYADSKNTFNVLSFTKVAGQRLASSRLFWPATGPYWQHCVIHCMYLDYFPPIAFRSHFEQLSTTNNNDY